MNLNCKFRKAYSVASAVAQPDERRVPSLPEPSRHPDRVSRLWPAQKGEVDMQHSFRDTQNQSLGGLGKNHRDERKEHGKQSKENFTDKNIHVFLHTVKHHIERKFYPPSVENNMLGRILGHCVCFGESSGSKDRRGESSLTEFI